MARAREPWNGDTVIPKPEYGSLPDVHDPGLPAVKRSSSQDVASGLIYLPSSAAISSRPTFVFFPTWNASPRPRTAMPRRAGEDHEGVWDFGRHRVGGRPDCKRHRLRQPRERQGRDALRRPGATERRRHEGPRREMLSEYDMDGWTVPDLIWQDDVS